MNAADVLILTDAVRISHPARFIEWYRGHVSQGPDYYRRRDVETPTSELTFSDLAWAVLLAGRPSPIAALNLLHASPIDISAIPTDPLESLDASGVAKVIDGIDSVIARINGGVRAALATKMLHPKRRSSVPVCDNKAIFGSFLRPGWRPDDPVRAISGNVEPAVRAIHRCVSRPENTAGWTALQNAYPQYQRVELFDMTWWALLRNATALTSADGYYTLAEP